MPACLVGARSSDARISAGRRGEIGVAGLFVPQTHSAGAVVGASDGLAPRPAFCGAPPGGKPPRSTQPTLSPLPAHFPVGGAWVCSDEAVSTPRGHTPVQKQRGPANPEPRGPVSIAENPRPRLPERPPAGSSYRQAPGTSTIVGRRRVCAAGLPGRGHRWAARRRHSVPQSDKLGRPVSSSVERRRRG